jgi:CNT family concentrative nucleoside transporter
LRIGAWGAVFLAWTAIAAAREDAAAATPFPAPPIQQDSLGRGDTQPQDTLAAEGARLQVGRGGGDSGLEPAEVVNGGPVLAGHQERGPRRIGREATHTPLHERLFSVLGTGLLVGIAWILSTNRRAVDWRIVAWGVGLQFIFALLVLKTGPGELFFAAVNRAFIKLLSFTRDGARFVFGNLVDSNVPVGSPIGDPASGNIPQETITGWAQTGAYFAFSVLPTIIFFSALMALLYHLRVLQAVVRFFAWIMRRTMRTSGAETLAASANIFVGQTEAPLMVRPFLQSMTRSELMCLMAAGFANTAGGVLAAYVGFLAPYFPDIAGHLLAASIMSAPAALAFSKIMLPETEEPLTRGDLKVEVETPDVNAFDATTRGASEGLVLAFNVGAMLIAFTALVFLVNALIGWAGGLVGLEGLTLQRILGWVLSPLAVAMGVPVKDAFEVGSLMGIKTVLNEFFAYLQLQGALQGGTDLDPRSVIIASYALSGFANFASIGIQIGGIGALVPERRHDLSRVGLRAMVAGSFASFQTATIAGILI